MKRTFALILAALMALTALVAVPVGAYGREITSGDWWYEVNEDKTTATINRYLGSELEVTIPSEIDGYAVTALGDWVDLDLAYSGYDYCYFGITYDRPTTNVIIPDSVTVIGTDSFGGCTSLTSVTIPDSVKTIGDYAFGGCTSLTSVTIPDSVKTIGDNSFRGCTSLTSVNIPYGMTMINRSTFFGCKSLTSVMIPDSVTTIGDYAFSGCDSMTSITIPDSVITIGEYAFDDCDSLAIVTIPDSVSFIGKGVLWNCHSVEVYYGGSLDQWNAIDKSDLSTEESEDRWILYYDVYLYLGYKIVVADIVFNSTGPVENPTPGDLNDDGKINSRDVIALMKLVLTPNAEVTAANDLNDDGKINSRDVILLMKLVLTQA